jgi:gamma-glutamyl hercynylcysteine S-oxide synthase
MKDLIVIRKKQDLLIKSLTDCGKSFFNLKVCDHLSPVGWHVMHCLFIECIWIRKLFLNKTALFNKLKSNSDSINIPVKKRGTNLPDFKEVLNLCVKEFKKNLDLIESISEKKIKKKLDINYILKFLINHHSQHLETIKSIINIIQINKKNYLQRNFLIINSNVFKIDPLIIKNGNYKYGSTDASFSYDNEKPINYITVNSFKIAKNLITVSQWLGFIKENGYKRKELWTNKGWLWKNKHNISKPLNWIFLDKRLSLCTYKGLEKPIETNPVTHISLHELEAFAKWQDLRIPHEIEWEIASKKLTNINLVWEWCNNIFYPYKGFTAFPYKEYSKPWFNSNYYTLRGSSIYSEKEIKRSTFRNFYEANTRHIFSGGRLSSN